jgi:hypothetical protein
MGLFLGLMITLLITIMDLNNTFTTDLIKNWIKKLTVHELGGGVLYLTFSFRFFTLSVLASKYLLLISLVQIFFSNLILLNSEV